MEPLDNYIGKRSIHMSVGSRPPDVGLGRGTFVGGVGREKLVGGFGRGKLAGEFGGGKLAGEFVRGKPAAGLDRGKLAGEFGEGEFVKENLAAWFGKEELAGDFGRGKLAGEFGGEKPAAGFDRGKLAGEFGEGEFVKENLAAWFGKEELAGDFGRGKLAGEFGGEKPAAGFDRGKLAGEFGEGEFVKENLAAWFGKEELAGEFGRGKLAGEFGGGKPAAGSDRGKLAGEFVKENLAAWFGKEELAGEFGRRKLAGEFGGGKLAGEYVREKFAAGFGRGKLAGEFERATLDVGIERGTFNGGSRRVTSDEMFGRGTLDRVLKEEKFYGSCERQNHMRNSNNFYETETADLRHNYRNWNTYIHDKGDKYMDGPRPRNGNSEEIDSLRTTDRYIPPDPPDDENEIFGSSISSGPYFNRYENIRVNVSGSCEKVPKPMKSFEESVLHKLILRNVMKSGYEKPTPIQKNAIPIILNGYDLIASAQTGSGKTAAYLLPIIHTLIQESKDLVLTSKTIQPQALILSPVHEVAKQIFNEARKFAYGSFLKISVSYGGVVSGYQKRQFLSGCHILVATPGRLLYFVHEGIISLRSVRFVVLDDADRLLNSDSLPAIEKLMSHPTMVLPVDRQTIILSVTLPKEIQLLATKFLMHDELLSVEERMIAGACPNVTQKFFLVQKKEKNSRLKKLLEEQGDNIEKTLVFVNTKRVIDFLALYLADCHIHTTKFHGDHSQREREYALADFRSGKTRVLLATGIASHGLDFKEVSHVINYNMPKTIAEYAKRIGRTGRIGNEGKSTSFFESGIDSPLARDLVQVLHEADQPVPDFIKKEALCYAENYQCKMKRIGVRNFDKGSEDEHVAIFGKGGVQPEPEEDW